MNADVITAQAHHCGIMARRLRASHHAILLRGGYDVHGEMRGAFDASTFRKSLLIDGHLAGIGGVVGSMASGEGRIWLALSDEATAYPFLIAREARRQLDILMQTHNRLITIILMDDAPSFRFASWLGFKDTGNRNAGMASMVYFGS